MISIGDRFIQIGGFRIADIDGNHMSIHSGLTVDIYRADNTIHPGPRLDFHSWNRRPTRQTDSCRAYQNYLNFPEQCGQLPYGGKGFIQIGNWRIGTPDGVHFAFSHFINGRQSVVFREDGTQHWGPRTDFHLFSETQPSNTHLGYATDIKIGTDYIEFAGTWRLGTIDGGAHLSISSVRTGKTAFIWRFDGTRHAGPRDDFNTKNNPETPSGVFWSDKMIRISQWTIGEIDINHMSIANVITSDIYRSDGTVHPGPRLDWQGNHLIPTSMAIVDKSKECPAKLEVNKRSAPACDFFLKGGDGFIEIGDWRFGNVDDIHFVFSHRDGRSSVLYRWDGNQYPNWGQNYGNNYGIWR